MPSIPHEALASLQSNPKNIRNICILAHVDHGKTTLSDALISSNGIISKRMAGKIRYLDNRPDEQERRITMKSSCISLLFKDSRNEDSYLVNLIDSPGHVDFSSEVSTAVRITDGALLVVDAIEGVCVQTVAVLRQAWMEKVKPCLVINKVDRLIAELHLSPTEAFHHIKKVLEHCNAVTAALFSEEYLRDLGSKSVENVTDEMLDWDSYEEKEAEVYFAPNRGNVFFASAYDGWGFRIDKFSELYSKKLEARKEVLQKTLWGEYYFNAKTKKIYQKNNSGKMVPMFAQFVLHNIWEVYNAALSNDKVKLNKIVKALNLAIPERELNSNEAQSLVESVMSRWLPIGDALLEMVAENLPSPLEAQKIRLNRLWEPTTSEGEIGEIQRILKASMEKCDGSDDAPIVAFVSKVFPVEKDALSYISNPNQRRESSAFLSGDQGETFVAMARIFSGNLRKGKEIHILGPRYHPSDPQKHHTKITVEHLFLLMGRSIAPVDCVPAGNVFGIGGFGDKILKTATLSSSEACSGFRGMTMMSSPIVRVAIEPKNILERGNLVKGLRLLNQADPSVDVVVQESGELVLTASGELHLERCLRDLREKYARVEVIVSPPLVAFRETITAEPSLRHLGKGPVEAFTSNKLGRLCLSAVPIPSDLVLFLDKNSGIIRRVFVEKSMDVRSEEVKNFKSQLQEELKKGGEWWAKQYQNIWSFGPRRIGCNLLLNHIPGLDAPPHWEPLVRLLEGVGEVEKRTNLKVAAMLAEQGSKPVDEDSEEEEEEEKEVKEISGEERIRRVKELLPSIVAGFQLATASGPMSEEPMMGVAFVVEDVVLLEDGREKRGGPFSGQIISAMKEGCREAFLAKSSRLMEAVYQCDVQVPADAMGKVFGVLGRRRAKVTNEEVREASSIFFIEALLPVVESFGFYDEILKQTSGAASVHLSFSGFRTIDIDPFFVPTNEEEIEDNGDNIGGMAPNIARQYMDSIRKRKGLFVEEKLVKHADKQSTLSKKK